MRSLVTASLVGLMLAASASAVSAAEGSSAPAASRQAGSGSEIARTAVSAVDVSRGVITTVDGRRLRYDRNDSLTLTLAYMSPDNVQFTTSVPDFVPMPAWYATVEGTHYRKARKASALRLTIVSEPTPQQKARCLMVTGHEAGGVCARPEGTSSMTWTGVVAGHPQR